MQDLTIEFDFRNQRFTDAAKGVRALADSVVKSWNGEPKVLSAELKTFLEGVARALAQRHGRAWPSGTTDKTLSKRSGASVQSILQSVSVNGNTFDTIVGHIGGKFPLQVHEFGATIKAKGGKFLTVPLPAALDGKGVPIHKSARDWQNTFVAKTKAGNLVIFQKRGTTIVPLYVLKTQVVIKPRLGMRATLQAGLPYFVDRTVDAMVRDMRDKVGL